MEIKIIREKLHQIIDEMDDKKAKSVYFLLINDLEKEAFKNNLFVMREKNSCKAKVNFTVGMK